MFVSFKCGTLHYVNNIFITHRKYELKYEWKCKYFRNNL